MAVGWIETSILTDIANAIRQQNGTSETYLPGEMAAAVLALDGTKEGEGSVEPYKQLESGIVSSGVFSGIAAAIRAQNGGSDLYEPGEMAQAILDLTWETPELAPRALLLSDGTLEFTYLESEESPSGGTVVNVYEIDPAGYESASERPWHGVRNSVTQARFDASFADAGIANGDWWFNGMGSLVSVEGFENFQGLTSATQMFAVCSVLESIYATEYDSSTIAASTLMFGNCRNLVGEDGTVPGTVSSSAADCHLGAGGLLVDPDDDPRLWFWGHVYADGTLEITADDEPDASKTLVASGRLCTVGKYNAIGAIPWNDYHGSITDIVIDEDMAGFDELSLCYTFYGLNNATSVTGMANLCGVTAMRYTFCTCNALTQIDLRGFDPSALMDVFYTFSSCASLVTILADFTWELPAGAGGMGCFYNSRALVGGAGTTYTSTTTGQGYKYFRIDGGPESATPGYLTAG